MSDTQPVSAPWVMVKVVGVPMRTCAVSALPDVADRVGQDVLAGRQALDLRGAVELPCRRGPDLAGGQVRRRIRPREAGERRGPQACGAGGVEHAVDVAGDALDVGHRVTHREGELGDALVHRVGGGVELDHRRRGELHRRAAIDLERLVDALVRLPTQSTALTRPCSRLRASRGCSRECRSFTRSTPPPSADGSEQLEVWPSLSVQVNSTGVSLVGDAEPIGTEMSVSVLTVPSVSTPVSTGTMPTNAARVRVCGGET
jgi:hypothetical protein